MAVVRPQVDTGVFVDFETVATADYNLKRLSTRRYVADSRFKVLGVSIAIGAGDVRFFWADASKPADALDEATALLQTACSEGYTFVSHNAGFDGLIAAELWGLTFERYFDTAGYCRFLGLGGSLASGADFIGKAKVASPTFSPETLENPQALAHLARYCATDTALCRELFVRASADTTFPDVEFDVIDRTVKMNLRGLHVDPVAVDGMLLALRRRRDAELQDFAQRYLFDPGDLTRPVEVKRFIRRFFDLELVSLAKTDKQFVDVVSVDSPAATFLNARARVLRLNQALKKCIALQSIGHGPVRNFIHYYGAHTGRFSGGGRDSEKLNVHGMAKHGGLDEVKLERSVIVPPAGSFFRAADLSTVEARVLAWVAGEEVLLERFAGGEDVYVWFAAQIFPETRIVKGGENGHLRALGKTSVLGLGFGMGLETFQNRARLGAPECSTGDVHRAYEAYRAAFPRIASVRKELTRAFERAIMGETTIRARWTVRPALDSTDTVIVDLPTERSLYYRGAVLDREIGSFGPRNAVWYTPRHGRGRAAGETAVSRAKGARRFPDGKVRRRLTPQVLVENVVQAIARDVMVHQALEVEHEGYPAAFHAHDELIVLCQRCDCAGACTACSWAECGAALAAAMSRVPLTLPRLRGLPLACELSHTIRADYGG